VNNQKTNDLGVLKVLFCNNLKTCFKTPLLAYSRGDRRNVKTWGQWTLVWCKKAAVQSEGAPPHLLGPLPQCLFHLYQARWLQNSMKVHQNARF